MRNLLISFRPRLSSAFMALLPLLAIYFRQTSIASNRMRWCSGVSLHAPCHLTPTRNVTSFNRQWSQRHLLSRPLPTGQSDGSRLFTGEQATVIGHRNYQGAVIVDLVAIAFVLRGYRDIRHHPRLRGPVFNLCILVIPISSMAFSINLGPDC